jgi:hypothetical protein
MFHPIDPHDTVAFVPTVGAARLPLREVNNGRPGQALWFPDQRTLPIDDRLGRGANGRSGAHYV